MPSCDMCGRETRLVKAIVEGTKMEVCKACSRFGKIIVAPKKNIIKKAIQKKKFQPKEEIVEIVLPNYGEIIRKKREKLGLKQIEVARMVAEKESIIQKIENNQFEPRIPLARKLERSLKIKLVDKSKDEKFEFEKSKEGDSLTLGHFIKKK